MAPSPDQQLKEMKKRRRERIVIALSLLSIVILTIAEIRLSSVGSEAPLSSNIVTFGFINVIVLLIILFVYLVARNILKLYVESRQKVIGANLRTKLVLSFVGLSLFPTMLLFVVSSGYISNSIQNWFNKEVESSLSESMEVAQTYYKSYEENALYYGRQISTAIRQEKLINQENLPRLRVFVKQKQKEYNLGVVEIYSSQKEELVRSINPSLPRGEFTTPDSEDIRNGLRGNEITRINSVGKADLIRGIVPISSTFNPREIVGVVVVNYYVPYSLVTKMKEITTSYHEFRQLKIMKNPITTGYILALFLITVTIIFLSVWFGFYLAKSLTTPLQELADATKRVTAGDLEVHLGETGTEEIGILINSFNGMIDEIKSSREKLQLANEELSQRNREIDQRRLYMETLLRSMTSGVVSINRHGVITTVNRAAETLLRIEASQLLGKNFRDILSSEHLDIMLKVIQDMLQNRRERASRQISLKTGDTRLILQTTITALRDDSGTFIGTMIVFDDITAILKAQRMAAWREVARRIAHEIKNPLTPIQLSAQRLRKRYLHLFPPDEPVFDQCTSMIIRSVEELKVLVDEFSRFARMPAAHPAPNDLNGIIAESLSLYQGTDRPIRLVFTPDRSLPPAIVDRDQMKRVFINLIDNALAAIEDEGEIRIETSHDPDLRMIVCTVADTGKGIPPEDRPRLFEPYFSTKRSGTGLGLAIVNSIISDHHGYIRCRDNTPRGTVFIIELPAADPGSTEGSP
ncbi:MAG: ATP-binding protein [Desulfuromonadia bacterium]